MKTVPACIRTGFCCERVTLYEQSPAQLRKQFERWKSMNWENEARSRQGFVHDIWLIYPMLAGACLGKYPTTEGDGKTWNYIYRCKNPDGGISYSSRNRGSSRPAITAAALAALYNAGDYDSKHVPEMLSYTKNNLHQITSDIRSFGHWHYTYLYYSQVVYRQGNDEWSPFRDKLYEKITSEQDSDGAWSGNIGKIYVTSCNLIMLLLDRGFLPIYQR